LQLTVGEFPDLLHLRRAEQRASQVLIGKPRGDAVDDCQRLVVGAARVGEAVLNKSKVAHSD